MMKIFKSVFIPVISLLFVITSCLNIDPVEFTAEKEQQDLASYLNELKGKGFDIDTTSLGVFYIRMKEGTGSFPVEGDTVSVKYVGYMLNGNVFDTSFYASADSSWTYVHKTGNLLPAWDEITSMMNTNCKMEFIIPSSLAYGATGAGVIPPYSPLVFVAIMSKIKQKN
jgi:FKBP-type peptidyl-prolyl cis-trans isomerase